MNNESEKPSRKSKNLKKEFRFQIRWHVKRITGVDLLAVKGFSYGSILTILSEVGTDMSKWKTEKHFTSWLGYLQIIKYQVGKYYPAELKKLKVMQVKCLDFALSLSSIVIVIWSVFTED